MPSEVVLDASGISPDVFLWLMKAEDGHYFIERKPNRSPSTSDRFRISENFAKKLMEMPLEKAWEEIERYVGAAPL